MGIKTRLARSENRQLGWPNIRVETFGLQSGIPPSIIFVTFLNIHNLYSVALFLQKTETKRFPESAGKPGLRYSRV